jgi:hypothetical protein
MGKKGYLKILIDPEKATDNEVCVEMLNYIEEKSPWPNWPVKNTEIKSN